MGKNEKIKITSKKLLLAEGRDAELFLVWACREHFQDGEFQVMNFGGNDELSVFLAVLTNLEGFDEVETIIIARDAESDASTAFQSVQSSISNNDLPCPQKAFDYQSNTHLKIAVLIFSGSSETSGTLEDLCLMTVNDDPAMNCVDTFLDCIESNGTKLPRKHKNKLHSYLSSTDDYVGLKIGEASHARAWDPSHSKLQPFMQIIKDI